MKILHLDEQQGWRGGEQQASWLIQASAAKGHEIWIAGRPDSRFLASDHGGAALTRIALPFWAEFDLYTAWRLAQTVYEHDIDIIHAHTSHTHAIACIARLFARRGAVVVSRRVSFPPRQDVVNRWKYGAPDVYLAVSEEVAAVLRRAGIAPDKVRRVYSAVDPERLNVEKADRASLGLEAKARVLFSAGALVGHKDHATLLDAMPRVREAYPDARLLIAGEGELREPLEAQIAALGLEDVVALLGHRDDAPSILRTSDLYVSSSWSEGLGTSVLEALACGVPVVATVAGGVPEMVEPGKTGYLVGNRDPEALADAIIEAIGHPRDAKKYAEAGRKRVEKDFTVTAMVEGTLAAYIETMNRVKGISE